MRQYASQFLTSLHPSCNRIHMLLRHTISILLSVIRESAAKFYWF